MQTQLKKIISIFAISILLMACSKNENPEPENPNAVKLRVKEIRSFDNSIIKKFEYNAQNLVTEIYDATFTVRSFYLYNSNGYLATEVHTDRRDPFKDVVIDYVFDANNAVDRKSVV